MIGLGRVIGAGTTIRINKKTYIVSPMTLFDLGMCEQHLRSKKRRPFELVLKESGKLTPEQFAILTKAATEDDENYQDQVTTDEFWNWMYSADGAVFTAWLSLRKQHACFEFYEQVLNEFDDAVLVEFVRVRDIASGIDLSAMEDWNSRGGGQEPVWRRLIGDIVQDSWGKWTFEAVASMTLYQVRVLAATKAELGGRVQMKPHEYDQFKEERGDDPSERKRSYGKLTDKESLRIHELRNDQG